MQAYCTVQDGVLGFESKSHVQSEHRVLVDEFRDLYDDNPLIMEYVMLQRTDPTKSMKSGEFINAVSHELKELLRTHKKPAHTKSKLNSAIVLLIGEVGASTVKDILEMLHGWNPFGTKLKMTSLLLERMIWCNFGKLAVSTDFHIIDSTDGSRLVGLSEKGFQRFDNLKASWGKKYPTVLNRLRS